MKKIFGFMLFPLLALTACEDFYSDKQLDYEYTITDVQSLSHVLETTDYAYIAGLEANKQIALQQDDDSTCYKALQALATTKCFSDLVPGELFIPAFIAEKYPQLSSGSLMRVTHNTTQALPAYMQDFAQISEYTLTDSDYESVWKETVQASYLTPATLSQIPQILAAAVQAQEGEIMVVNYMYDEVEPSIGGSAEQPEKLSMETADFQLLLDWVVTNQDSGYLDTRYDPITAEYYFGAATNFANINNKISTWKNYYDPEKLYANMSDAEMTQLMADRLAWGIANIVLPAHYPAPEASNYIVSFDRYTDDGTTEENQTFTYAEGKFNATACSYASLSGTFQPTIKAQKITANQAAVYVFQSGLWKAYETDDATVTAVPQPVYNALGESYISKPQEIIPIFMSQTYPYAQADDVYAVVYNGENGMAISEFSYDGSKWNMTTDIKTAVLTFELAGKQWVAKQNLYLSETFADNRQGDFTIQDVALDGLSYVWATSSSYGMKASAYVGGNHATESWLISPLIDLKDAMNPVLSFDQAVNYTKAFTDECFIMVSTDFAGDVTACSWKHLPFNKDENDAYIVPPGNNWDFMNTGNLSLSDYCGKVITIAFKYTSSATTSATWEIKNLVVQEEME